MLEPQQHSLEQEHTGEQVEVFAQPPSDVLKNPEYNPDKLQRSFEIVNQESEHFRRECVMHQQAQAMGMSIDEYRRWYELRSKSSNLRNRLTQPLVGFWHWTGFGEKKLWDILQLLIVPAILAGGAFYLQESTKQKDQRLAGESRRQESLNKYFDIMTNLVLDRKLRASKLDDEVRTIARAKTLAIFQELTPNPLSSDINKILVLNFLQETQLIEKDRAVVSMRGADFTAANLYMADLRELNLSGALFLEESYLDTVNLSGTDLNNAYFYRSNLREANLSNANLSEARFNYSSIHDANFSGANLSGTRFRGSNLQGTHLTPTQLDQAKFCDTALSDGKISNRDCNEIELKE